MKAKRFTEAFKIEAVWQIVERDPRSWRCLPDWGSAPIAYTSGSRSCNWARGSVRRSIHRMRTCAVSRPSSSRLG